MSGMLGRNWSVRNHSIAKAPCQQGQLCVRQLSLASLGVLHPEATKPIVEEEQSNSHGCGHGSNLSKSLENMAWVDGRGQLVVYSGGSQLMGALKQAGHGYLQ